MVAASVVQISYGFTFSNESAYQALATKIKIPGTNCLEPLPTRQQYDLFKYNYWNTNRHRITYALENNLNEILAQDTDLVVSGPDYERDIHLHGSLDYQRDVAVTFGLPAITMNSESVEEGETVVYPFDSGRFQFIEKELGTQVQTARNNLLKLGIEVGDIGWLRVEFTQ